ncbi:HNH endonuclease signature motif containing protein [Agromyces subbeticus]|uniref:HNH endonuclease signature motif containing protein n=1 Tax=Agromyces subbeticus TaxID=293890 RepID=UPI0003B76C67|nr:HNH endonuclease signature motif containing protein [Agromyces subbeticus]
MPEAPAALLELEAACAAVLRQWAGALLGSSSDAETDIRAMNDDGLVRATEALAQLCRRVEALQARCAAGIAERSRGVDDGADLARKHGFASPERLIAQTTGGRYTDAARLVAVGQATSRRASFTGEALPPRHPHVAQALDAGTLGVAAADVIRRFLDHLPPSAARDELDAAEQLLVDRAPAVGVDGLVRLIRQLEAHLDPDGVKPSEDELRARRGLSVWQDAAGMINLKGAFDPANGAPIKLAIEALVSAELHRARDAKRGFGERGDADAGAGAGAGAGAEARDTGADPLFREERTIAQLNADALSDIARLSLSSAGAPPALRSVTVVARLDVEALVSGRGHATIDGVDQPVSVATARELAESAGVAPMLMRNGCEVLDLGRAARLFSPAQKLALVERDGGCAWPACQRPPSHAQAHHIAWWGRHHGRTELSNGIMLCSFHHHRVHDDGWSIRIRDGRSWFVPPVHLDPEQRPRPGNVAPRLHLARRSATHPSADSGPPSAQPRTAAA